MVYFQIVSILGEKSQYQTLIRLRIEKHQHELISRIITAIQNRMHISSNKAYASIEYEHITVNTIAQRNVKRTIDAFELDQHFDMGYQPLSGQVQHKMFVVFSPKPMLK